jgi:hypothetical protein
VAWYRFENLTDSTIDSSSSRLNPLLLPTERGKHCAEPTAATKGAVGSYLKFNEGKSFVSSPNKNVSWGAVSPLDISSADGLTIEFLLKPSTGFLRGGEAWLLNALTPAGQNASLKFNMRFDGIYFSAPTAGPSSQMPVDDLKALFSGSGVLAADYFWGGKTNFGGSSAGWHHIALVKDGISGDQAIWINGNCTTMAGNATHRKLAPIRNLTIDFANPVALAAGLDEIAIYDTALPPSMIYQHFIDALVHGKPYSRVDPGGVPPPPTRYPLPNETDYYDKREYAPGTQLPSPAGKNNTLGASATCLEQMQYAPGPRYNQDAIERYSIPYNFNWMNPSYMVGADTGNLKPNLTLAMVEVLARRWRYGLTIPTHPNRSDGGEIEVDWLLNATISLGNQHPHWAANLMCSGAPAGSNGQTLRNNQTLPKGCYLQDAHGQFVNVDGSPALPDPKHPGGVKKSRRPTVSAAAAAAQGCPDSLAASQGVELAREVFTPLSTLLTRPLTIVNADGEVFIGLSTPAEDYNFSVDPVVLKDFTASGAPDWLSFWSAWRARLTNAITDAFLKDPELAGPKGVLHGTYFTQYQIQGTNPYFGNWSQTRKITSPMPNRQTGKLSYFSTEDTYMRNPLEWWQGRSTIRHAHLPPGSGPVGPSPDHSLQWLQNIRATEIAAGDTLFRWVEQ